MRELVELLSGHDEEVELDQAALELATIEYPQIEIGSFLEILDSYAVELAGRLQDGVSGPDFVIAANQYLFNELGFTGNAKNYYDPRNSCLNEVLTERTGIPITLCLVYMEIACVPVASGEQQRTGAIWVFQRIEKLRHFSFGLA